MDLYWSLSTWFPREPGESFESDLQGLWCWRLCSTVWTSISVKGGWGGDMWPEAHKMHQLTHVTRKKTDILDTQTPLWCALLSESKLKSEAVNFFLWKSINKSWAFMKEIKNLCPKAFGSWTVKHRAASVFPARLCPLRIMWSVSFTLNWRRDRENQNVVGTGMWTGLLVSAEKHTAVDWGVCYCISWSIAQCIYIQRGGIKSWDSVKLPLLR